MFSALKLEKGRRVTHFDGSRYTHGKGTIVDYNQTKRSHYVEEKLLDAIGLAVKAGVSLSGVVESFYNDSDYPYVVQWDHGYKDVYDAASLNIIVSERSLYEELTLWVPEFPGLTQVLDVVRLYGNDEIPMEVVQGLRRTIATTLRNKFEAEEVEWRGLNEGVIELRKAAYRKARDISSPKLSAEQVRELVDAAAVWIPVPGVDTTKGYV